MAQIEFGSKEWFEKLNGIVEFPEKFVFYYNKKENIIQVSKLDTKGKIENARWRSIQPTPLSFHPTDETAVIDVIEVNNAQKYHDILKKLQKIWVVKK